MPLGCDLGIFCSEIVEAWQYLRIGTVWAAAIALGATGDNSLIIVAFGTAPPDFFIAGGSNLLRSERAIFGWVPLTSELGIIGGEIVLSAQECAIAANRTTSSSHAALNLSTPFVPMFTLPPNQTVAAREHIS